MKVTKHYESSGVTVEFEAQGRKEVFQYLAGLAEILEVEPCGECGSTNVVHEFRTVESNNYFSLRCKKCHAQLDFGQNKVGGGLFIRRKDKDGNFRGTKRSGWYKWSQQSNGDAYSESVGSGGSSSPQPATEESVPF